MNTAEHSIMRYGGLYHTELVWDKILQYLGIGEYKPDWIVGRIYIPQHPSRDNEAYFDNLA